MKLFYTLDLFKDDFFFSYKIGGKSKTTLKEICKNEKQEWKLQDVDYYTYRWNSIQAP